MKYKSQIFDQMQDLYAVTGFNDHQLHGFIQFEEHADEAVMKRAAELLLRAVPILSRVYRCEKSVFFWEDADTAVQPDFFTVTDSRAGFEAVAFSKTDEKKGPQIRFCLLKAEKDALSVVVNHMVTDGAGFKQCLYLLADIYSRLVDDPAYVPGTVIDGCRGLDAVTRGLKPSQRLKTLVSGDNNQTSRHEMPFGTSEDTAPFILMRTLPEDLFRRMRALSRESGATLNDILYAGYCRAVVRTAHFEGEALGIPIMIDMRRYLEDKELRALTNLSSTAIIPLTVEKDERFARTLEKVRAATAEKKSGLFGMSPFLKLGLLYRLAGKSAYGMLKNGLKNPKIGMTNIGIVDDKKLVFKNAPVENAAVCGSIKYRPYFQLAVSTYKEKMNLVVNLYGDGTDRANFTAFLALVERELEEGAKESILS